MVFEDNPTKVLFDHSNSSPKDLSNNTATMYPHEITFGPQPQTSLGEYVLPAKRASDNT